MAVKLKNLQPGQVIYSRGKRCMGNTTAKTIVQYASTVVAVDLEKRRVTLRFQGSKSSIPERLLSRYFDWSIHDPTKAKLTKNILGAIVKVEKLKQPHKGKE